MPRRPAMPPASAGGVGSVLGRCGRCARAHRTGRASPGNDERVLREERTMTGRRTRDARGPRSGERDSRRLRIRAAVDTARARQSVVGRAMRVSGDRREAIARHGDDRCGCVGDDRRRDEIDRRNGTRRLVMHAVCARGPGAQRRACREQRDQQEDDARHPASIPHRHNRRRGGRNPRAGVDWLLERIRRGRVDESPACIVIRRIESEDERAALVRLRRIAVEQVLDAE